MEALWNFIQIFFLFLKQLTSEPAVFPLALSKPRTRVEVFIEARPENARLHCTYFSQNLYTEVNTEWNTQRKLTQSNKKYILIVRRRCQKPQNKGFYFILNEMYVNIL